MTSIAHLQGDATEPQGDPPLIITHVVTWDGEGGFSVLGLSLSNKWTAPEMAYRKWVATEKTKGFHLPLGEVQFVEVQPGVTVANMVAQRGLRGVGNTVPLSYPSLRFCLARVASRALETAAAVHMPRIGCGLAGGRWENVELLIRQELCQKGVGVTVYDL